jgi:hypothetical protein
VFENRVRRSIFGPEINDEVVTGVNCTMRSFTICILKQLLLGLQNQVGQEEWGMQHIWAEKKCIESFGLEILNEREHWEDIIIDGKIIYNRS